MVPGSETVVLSGKMKEPTRIAQAECSGHPWYVSRRFNTKNYKDTQYLHGDGVWRPQTWEDGRFTGLFQNRDEALSAIANFESREAGGSPPMPEQSDIGASLLSLERIIMRAEAKKKKGHYDGE
jgi:hypothetical protein